MKSSDIIGFAALLTAGYYAGSQSATGTLWNNYTNLFIVGALIAIGFYFAVVLS
jgi:hypothetical protein